jgi:hypothetical protein
VPKKWKLPQINWMLFWTALGALAAVVALLVGLGFHSSDSGGDSGGGSAAKPDTVSETTDEPRADPEVEDPAGGEELWGGEISLIVNENYALDGFPIEPFEGYCDGCIMVNSFATPLALEVENGVRNWAPPDPPSYEDCAELLASGPAPSVALVESPNSEGLAEGDWACAYSKSGEILRLGYKGESEDGVNFRFTVTGWSQAS